MGQLLVMTSSFPVFLRVVVVPVLPQMVLHIVKRDADWGKVLHWSGHGSSEGRRSGCDDKNLKTLKMQSKKIKVIHLILLPYSKLQSSSFHICIYIERERQRERYSWQNKIVAILSLSLCLFSYIRSAHTPVKMPCFCVVKNKSLKNV